MRRFPRRWWVAGAGAVVAIEVVFVWLAPVVLDPLFNRYEDLPQGRTRAAVTQLAQRAGVDVGDVLVVDASRRTTAANAYVGGIGHTKRVVLYDTLLERFDPAQVDLVVAHELGHVKQRDVARGMLWVAIVAAPGMYVVMLLTRRWSARAGAPPGAPGSVPALALALAVVSFGLTVVSNQLSRAVENRADAYSLELTGRAARVHRAGAPARAGERQRPRSPRGVPVPVRDPSLDGGADRHRAGVRAPPPPRRALAPRPFSGTRAA